MSTANTLGPSGRPTAARKLIAVIYADMVGYSRLIGLDDIGTLERLRTLRSTLIDPAIEEHGGRIVQTGGDSLLIVFDSIDGAVRCAVKVQQQVPSFDGDRPPDRYIRFRIGINIGDAIADGTDLHGDGVNVAVRLQAEAPPGGICVSRAVRDHVHDRLALNFETLGPLMLKNIARPVEAFVLKPASGETKAVESLPKAFPLPDRPSIAVLPFANLSADPEQEYFSDGVADDIITELSRDRALFVIARNSSFIYRGRSVEVKQVGRELGVRYVVEGSVRRDASRVRITAQLIDAMTGAHVWAERYDRKLEDVFAVQDEIAEAVATAIRPAVGDAEQRRALRKPPGSLSAWEAYQRGMWHLSKGTPAEHEKARALFKQAAQLGPDFAAPFVALSAVYLMDFLCYGMRSSADAVKLQEEAARIAVAIDPNCSEGHAMLGFAFASAGNMAAQRICNEHALALNRNSAFAHLARGANLLWSAQLAESRKESLMSLRLDPHGPFASGTLANVAAAHYLDGDYGAAVETARHCLSLYPFYAPARRWLVPGLGQLGKVAEAHAALDEFKALALDVFNVLVVNRPPHVCQRYHEHMLEGFRKAGWQG